MAAQRIQLRRDTAAEWQKVNPVLSSGEPGVEVDTGKWKIGDGTLAWKALPYKAEAGPPGASGPSGPSGPTGPSGPSGPKGDAGIAGPAGPSNTLTIGSVIAGPTAFASLSGTAPSQSLNLTLPKGDRGDPCSLSIGTVATGASAAATVTGTSPNFVLNLSIPKGETGAQGAQGNKGDTGAQGPQGAQGPTGSQGIPGEKGLKGDAGAQGPQGAQGPAGATGPAGSQGTQGLKGDAGATGSQGPKGDTGAAAKIMGEATKWPPATTPAVGDLWIADDPLPTGFPAGSVAGDGFVWTGTVWLNAGPIRGPKGDPGPKGDIGATGPAGAAGATGPTGPAGPSGAKGDTGATGPAGVGATGPTGATGPAGPKGDTGATGPVGTSSSLSVGTVTSGDIPSVTITGTAPNQSVNFVLAKGATGPTGLTGPMGPAGPAGPSNVLRIGTVTAGDTPAATITGASPTQTLSLVVPKAQSNTLTIGTVTAGATANATLTGTAPNQVLNLVLPNPAIQHTTSFYSNPTSQTVQVGNDVTFYAYASSTEYPIIYMWQYSDDPELGEAGWFDRPGAGSEAFTLNDNTDRRDGRWYRCTATTPTYGRAYSTMAQLTITYPPDYQPGAKTWKDAVVDGTTDRLLGNMFGNTCTLAGDKNEGLPTSWGIRRTSDGRLFTGDHTSTDGIKWTRFIGERPETQGYLSPPMNEVILLNGVYVMWSSLPLMFKKWYQFDPSYQQTRYVSSNGTQWRKVVAADVNDSVWAPSGIISWDGCYPVPSPDRTSFEETNYNTYYDDSNIFRLQTGRRTVSSWKDGHSDFTTATNRLPVFFGTANGLDFISYKTSGLDQNMDLPTELWTDVKSFTSYVRSSAGVTSAPQNRIIFQGAAYGMVNGSMRSVAMDHTNFYVYAINSGTPTLLSTISRPLIPMGPPVYGNGTWLASCTNQDGLYYMNPDISNSSGWQSYRMPEAQYYGAYLGTPMFVEGSPKGRFLVPLSTSYPSSNGQPYPYQWEMPGFFALKYAE